MSFNLVDEPWVPVRYRDRREAELSLRVLFADVPMIRELAIAFALELVATQRMLVAIMQAALGEPTSREAKSAWLDDHVGCRERIDAYFDEWHGRFDLFAAERPFLQGTTEAVGVAPSSALRPDWASGNNATLFDHHVDARPEPLRPADAARALLTTLLFQPGGGVSKPFNRTDSPGTKALHVLAEAGDLWTTLVLNAPSFPSTDRSRPAWERDDERVPVKAGTRADGWLDRATWRSRAITLLRDDDGQVRGCRLHQHLKLDDEADFDPYAPVRRAESVEGKVPTVMRASGSRAIWRDAEALLRGLADKHRAGVVAQAIGIAEDRGDPAPALRVVGQVVNQAKIADVRDARLPVSAAMLRDEMRLSLVGALMRRAEDGGQALRRAIHAYGVALKVVDPWALAAPWEVEYWAALAPRAPALLAAIANAESCPTLDDAPSVEWAATIGRTARAVFETFGSQSGLRPEQLRAQAVALRVLQAALARIVPTKEAA